MSMAGVNPAAAGGPVGGGMMMMPDGSPAQSAMPSDQTRAMLNTYIYEYFLKIGMHDVARTLSQQPEKFKIQVATKQSPGRRKDGEANGVEGDAMDVDSKMDIPDDLPRPAFSSSSPQGTGFLLEWFGIFFDIYHASRKGSAGPAQQYLMHAQNMQRMRENSQTMMRPGMMNANQYAMRANMRNGMVNGGAMPAEMAKRMTPQQMQNMMQQKQMQQQQQQQMQREGGDVDMNGRPGTPAEGDNGGSPSKRPRLEGQQQFNGNMMANGRPMPGGVPQGMMIQNAFNPQNMNPQFRPNAGMQGQKAPMQPGMAPNGGMNMMNNAGSPMMVSQFGSDAAMEMYNSGRMGGQMQGNPAAQSGNHALQDYQMQLMLLEQQNKKRLMMARQEQDNQVQRDGAPMPGVMGGTGMSPSGSRSGTSPNPADQMKRTPQIGGLPGSPSAGENMQGRSPAAMGFMNGSMPGDGFNPMFMGDKQGMAGPGGPNMRPPTSMNMQGRMGAQFQGGQPMAQQPSQGGQQPMGTPGQRNEMPPPQAPAGNANRQASSPAQSGGNAPPTPSQTNKANPKNKKGKDDGAATGNAANNKKKPTKKNSQANAPGDKGQPAAAPANAAPPPAPVPQMPPNQNQMQQPDMSQNASFDFGSTDQNFNLDFSTLENTDVLENFDFDSFLNTSNDDAFNFENGMNGVDFLDTTGE